MSEVVQKRLTAAGFRQLPETMQRQELIGGEVVVSPAPKDPHQSAVEDIYFAIRTLIAQGKLSGRVKVSPADVYLSEYDVLQPDVFFIASDNSRCTLGSDGYWHGAPNLVVEVLSPATARRDRVDKFQLYEKHGCHEYWIVEPVTRTIEVWGREDDAETFHLNGTYGHGSQFISNVLGGLSLSVDDLLLTDA